MQVFIVDDHELFRDGLRSLIESLGNGSVVAEAASVRGASALLDSVRFDLAVVDIGMRGLSGISLVREIRRRKLKQPILVLSPRPDADLAAEALAAGATGLALKSDTRADLLHAIQTVARGVRFIAAQLPRETIETFLRTRPGASGFAGPLALLSPREREVFDLLVRGFGNNEIAAELSISLKTVDSHRTHVFRKLHVHSLSELLRFSFRHQLVKETS